MLPSALNFTDLPSDRNVKFTPAGRLIRELAEKAWSYGPNGAWGCPGDQARRVQDKIARGEEVGELNWLLRPGGYIEERCTSEQRAVLRTLTSKDMEDAEVNLLMACGGGYYAGPGLRWKFGPYVEIKETLPTTWELSR